MKTALPLFLMSAVALAGCDQIGLGNDSAATDTNMRSVDIQAGTASDEMVILDTASGDGTAIDPSSAAGPAAPRPAADADADADDDAASGSETATATPAPAEPAEPAEPADPPEPAEK